MRIHIKEGAAVEGESKCASCSHGHMIRGVRESDELVFCNFAYELIRIPFKVRECSNHRDRNRPDWRQMEDLAIDIQPLTSAKPAGFRLVRDSEQNESLAEAEVVSTE